MKLFVFALILVGCLASFGNAGNTQSEQLVRQIQCYLKKLKAMIPADAKPIDQLLIQDAGAVQDAIDHLDGKKIGKLLNKSVNEMQEILPKINDPKLRALDKQVMARTKPIAKKFEAGTGNFNDMFTLNTFIRDTLNKNLNGGCGKSSLPHGESSSDEAVAKIKAYLRKLKTKVPANALPIVQTLADNTVAVQKVSQEFKPKKLVKILKKDVKDVQKFIPKVKNPKVHEHQEQILAKLKGLIKQFESGTGTFEDLYKNFYLFIEKTLAKDLPK